MVVVPNVPAIIITLTTPTQPIAAPTQQITTAIQPAQIAIAKHFLGF